MFTKKTEEKTYIESKIVIEGFHFWKNAPEEVAFLKDNHRHLFVIRARKEVFHDDRDVEFILFGRKIKQYLIDKYGDIAHCCQFGGMSCEMIAKELISQFELNYCSVFEDDENGAIVTQEEIARAYMAIEQD